MIINANSNFRDKHCMVAKDISGKVIIPVIFTFY